MKLPAFVSGSKPTAYAFRTGSFFALSSSVDMETQYINARPP
jgi:hypothetical protein